MTIPRKSKYGVFMFYSQWGNKPAMPETGMAAKKNCPFDLKAKFAYRSWGLTVLRRLSFVLLMAASSAA